MSAPDHPLRSLRLRLSPLFGPAGLQVVRLYGPAKFTGAPIRALYAGNGGNEAFLRGLFFEQAAREPLAHHSTPWRLDSRLRRLAGDVDLCLSELPPLWAALDPAHAMLRVPAWVRQVITLPASSPGRLFPHAVEREVSRHIRRRGYRIDFSTGEGDARRFFHDLYQPYVRARFGAEAVLVTEQAFLARCRGQTLARLWAGDCLLAGMLLLRRGGTLRLGWFGAAADPPPAGASEVLDVLAIRHAHGHGARRVVLGNSRPCLADGVLRYKARLGGRLSMAAFPQAALGISFRQPGAAVLECLARQPLIARMGQSALGVYCVRGGGIRLERFDGSG